jgi:hypothetical protein
MTKDTEVAEVAQRLIDATSPTLAYCAHLETKAPEPQELTVELLLSKLQFDTIRLCQYSFVYQPTTNSYHQIVGRYPSGLQIQGYLPSGELLTCPWQLRVTDVLLGNYLVCTTRPAKLRSPLKCFIIGC